MQEAGQRQEPVTERPPPRLADYLRTEHGVTELPRNAGIESVPAVDRKRKDVGDIVRSEVLALQRTHLLGPDEVEAELPILDALFGEDALCECDRRLLLDLD